MKKKISNYILITFTLNIFAVPITQCNKNKYKQHRTQRIQKYRHKQNRHKNRSNQDNKNYRKKIERQQRESREKRTLQSSKTKNRTKKRLTSFSINWKNNKLLTLFFLFLIITSVNGEMLQKCSNCNIATYDDPTPQPGACCPDGKIHKNIPWTLGILKKQIKTKDHPFVLIEKDIDKDNSSFELLFRENTNPNDPTFKDKLTNARWDFAMNCRCTEPFKTLPDREKAVQIFREKAFQRFIEENAETNQYNYAYAKRGNKKTRIHTPLHLAILSGHTEIVRTIIESGANVNAVDRWKRTPLDSATQYGYTEIAQVLREAMKKE